MLQLSANAIHPTVYQPTTGEIHRGPVRPQQYPIAGREVDVDTTPAHAWISLLQALLNRGVVLAGFLIGLALSVLCPVG
jgi:hypothetical protein